jgi:hypothetical protein
MEDAFRLITFFGASVALMGLSFCWLITAVFIGYLIRLFVCGHHTSGAIVGYGRKKPGDPIYYPVIEFTDQNGMTHQTSSDEGSSAFNLNAIGQRMRVSYIPGEAMNVHVEKSFGTYVILLVLLAISVGGFLILNSNFHFRPAHFVAAAIGVGVTFFRLGLIHGIFKVIKDPSWKMKSISAMDSPLTLVPIEELKSTQATLGEAQQKQMRSMPWPLFAIIGAGLFFLCFYLSQKQWHLQQVGEHRAGQIVDYHHERSTGSHSSDMYYAIVQFDLPSGETIRFQDRVGFSMVNSESRDVTVLYEPAHPRNAMIDRGIYNWIGPLALFGFGALLLLISVKIHSMRKSLVA